MAHSILAPTDFHTETIRVGDLTMNVALEGDPDAPLVLLLHGFPEFWYSWRHQIKALAAAGYRVAAPDQRGYNLTEKKPPYDLITLSNDAAGVITALGKEKAFVVGHDWGGGVAWIMGAYHPEMVEKVVICNVPHPLVMAKMLRSSPRQLLKSWYMLFFQLPALPEALLAMRNYKALVDTLKSVSTVTPEEIEYFKVAWKQPGALNGSLNWYRIAFRTLGKVAKRDLILKMPTRIIWGDPDPVVDRSAAEASRKFAPGCDLIYLPGGGHFVQQERPDEVNQLILAFLNGSNG